MSFLKLVAYWLVSLVLFIAVVIVVSSDDENPRVAIVGALLFFVIATVSYGYCIGLGWDWSAGRGLEAEAGAQVDAKRQATRGNRGGDWQKKQGTAHENC